MSCSKGLLVALCVCVLFVAVACSSDSANSGGPRVPGTGAGPGTGAPGGGPGTGSVAGGAGSNGFGNSTTKPMIVGDPNAPVTKCKSPTIAFVIDGSGSMCAPFGGSTRWQAVRTALIDPKQGLITRLADRGNFGALFYDGTIDLMLALSAMPAGGAMNPTCAGGATLRRTMGGMCPQLVEVAPARNNAANISQKFPQMELGGSTPTDKAMNHQVDALIAAQVPPWDPVNEPQFIILATDGQPNDICTGGMGGDGTAQQAAVIAAVDRAAQAGIITFVISLAGGDAGLEMHLSTVALHGDPANPAAHSFSPMNPADLTMTLTTLLGNAFGCNVG
jgi:hypothetical protein